MLAKLLLTGSITYYLAPRLQMLCYVTLGILVLLSVMSLVQAIRGISDDACDCGGVHALPSGFWKNILIYSLFRLPVAMGLFLPDKVLGSEVAQQKGVNLLKGTQKRYCLPTRNPRNRPLLRLWAKRARITLVQVTLSRCLLLRPRIAIPLSTPIQVILIRLPKLW
ncbi:DUF1980 domain-containing protein [Brevibacillus massiliensis]|uniref:DUF1980 domain-containing protein n=1 Tax=Brevibacillus massiliensis TaxID=1118054 RepID=UPI0002EE66C1|nr:DUF1980 domain-containing protein [Brevibacillus massiliensis]